MLKTTCSLLLFAVLPITIQAQVNDADINLFFGIPQGEFQENLDATAIGINGSVAFAIPSSPLSLGLELGIMTYGTDSRDESFNPNIPEVTVEVNTMYDIFTAHTFIRYEARSGVMRPYIDGLVGLNYLFTETNIQDQNNYQTIASDTNFDDTAFSYGVGGGLKFRVAQTETNQYLINLKGRYLLGSEADYLQEGSLEVVEGQLFFDESTSKTDILTIHVGLSVKF